MLLAMTRPVTDYQICMQKTGLEQQALWFACSLDVQSVACLWQAGSWLQVSIWLGTLYHILLQ